MDKKLIKKRGQLKAQLTKFQTYLETCDIASKAQLQIRFKKAEELWDKFEDVQTAIEDLTDDSEKADVELQIQERSNFENNYCATIASASDKLDSFSALEISSANRSFSNTSNLNGSNVGLANHDRNQTPRINVKLPILNLPTFNGDYDQWLLFKDSFNSLIDVNTELSEIQKFQYLRSSLKDQALQVIQALETSAGNYKIGWELLKQRYENQRLIINTHMKQLFELSLTGKETHINLQQFIDHFKTHMRALETLKQPVKEWDTMLIFLALGKLDFNTRRDWEKQIGSQEKTYMPKMSEFMEFLSNRCHTWEMIERGKSKPEISKFAYNKQNNKKVTLASTFQPNCVYCKGAHTISKCDEITKLSVAARQEETRKIKLCSNCLKRNHESKDCNSPYSCRHCAQKHHSLLHPSTESTTQMNAHKSSHLNSNSAIVTCCAQENDDSSEQVQSTEAEMNIILSSQDSSKRKTTSVILLTAKVSVYDRDGNRVTCRALLDPGSQSNIITTELAQKLRLSQRKINLPISGINKAKTVVKNQLTIKIKSQHSRYETELDCLVLPTITGILPQAKIDTSTWSLPRHIQLADPEFHQPGKIDLLIGAGCFWKLLNENRTELAHDQPILQNTLLGWIIGGENTNDSSEYATCHLVVSRLEEQLNNFFRIENLAEEKRRLTKDESWCEAQFSETVQRPQKRYIVSLPKNSAVILGKSRESAVARLMSLERRLKRQPKLKDEYLKFMRDYESTGHMTQQIYNKILSDGEQFFLPHHPVVRESSITTKVRVVFDGSAKTSLGTSLNDKLFVGPNLQEDLVEILIRFRTHEYVITADIEKMFRQIDVLPADRPLQQILWREDPSHEIKAYTLNTVTYGTTCAPFLAMRCLRQLAQDEGPNFPLAAEALRKDFYMDDALTGARTLKEIIQKQIQLSKLLEEGGFRLRKWRCNHEQILSHLADDRKADNLLVLDDSDAVKTLGLLWNSKTDVLQYSIHISEEEKYTKRNILSKIAQIYDPLGLIGPILLNAKILMQQLWKLDIGWDCEVPQDIDESWRIYYRSLLLINKLKIDRNVNLKKSSNQVDLHGFADASEKGYGACVYVVSRDSNGVTTARLLCSKSRVAPVKQLTLPRLELNAAVLLSRLILSIRTSLQNVIRKIYLWSDSTIVLYWMRTSPEQLKTFVANRVVEILEYTYSTSWLHVPTADNPADILSRGITVENLITNQLWWEGPQWIREHSSEWPKQEIIKELEIPELRTLSVHAVVYEPLDVLQKYSSYEKLIRVIATVRRFHLKCKGVKLTASLTVDELDAANVSILIMTQRKAFDREMKDLQAQRSVKRWSQVLSFKPWIDNKGLLRVGGRLENASIATDQKNPILLPCKNHVTELIMKHEHERLHHCGPEQLLNSIRQKYWPISGRREARKVTRRCVTCFRYQPKPIETVMSDLPKERLTEVTRPFETCGIDYAGPLRVRKSKRRGNIPIAKAYIAVFTCFQTKAVHLELVSDLSTEIFLAAFRRFIARRGICKIIYSDNGTNFVGAARELREVYQFLNQNNQEIYTELARLQIKWRFIPPRAPHFGGLWEAAVKATKRHLHKIVQNLVYTFEEYYTLLTQIEAILNSRPLTPLSSDPTDLSALTPSHFLSGDSLLHLPEISLVGTPDNLLSRWKHVQKLSQHFWQRWSKEYLHQLQSRSKWIAGNANLEVGEMVLLVEDNVPPLQWVLGRVLITHPGADWVVRVVTVRTAAGLSVFCVAFTRKVNDTIYSLKEPFKVGGMYERAMTKHEQ